MHMRLLCALLREERVKSSYFMLLTSSALVPFDSFYTQHTAYCAMIFSIILPYPVSIFLHAFPHCSRRRERMSSPESLPVSPIMRASELGPQVTFMTSPCPRL